MKKLLVLTMALLVSGAILAQGEKKATTGKSFLAFHAGPSIPVDEYAAKTFSTDGFFGGGGFANTGYSINLRYDYRFTENFGLGASVFYNNNKLNNRAFVNQLNLIYEESGFPIDATGLKLDHWKWYGITAGPALLYDVSKNVTAGLRIMGGIANANSPKVTYEGENIFGEDWSYAAVFQGGMDVRIGVGGNVFVFANADYTYLKPRFEKVYIDPILEEQYTETGYQKMSVVNLTAGLGIRF